MKNETDVIKIRIETEIKKKLESISESEQRTFAGQVRLALQEWINQRGASCAKAIRKNQENQWKMKCEHRYTAGILIGSAMWIAVFLCIIFFDDKNLLKWCILFSGMGLYLIGITLCIAFFVRCRNQSRIMPKPITNEDTLTFGDKGYSIKYLQAGDGFINK
jgi:hypothetical protein